MKHGTYTKLRSGDAEDEDYEEDATLRMSGKENLLNLRILKMIALNWMADVCYFPLLCVSHFITLLKKLT